MIRLLSKVRENGWAWLIARVERELTAPTIPAVRSLADGVLKLRRRLSPRRDGPLLHAIYDLEVCAETFNLAEFLVAAELEAQRLGKEGFVLIIVPPRPERLLAWKEFDSVVDAASRQWRLNNILVPLASLCEACKGTYVLPSRGAVAPLLNEGPVYPPLYDGTNLRGLDTARFYRELDRPGLFKGLTAPRQAKRYIEAWKAAKAVSSPIVTITIRQFGFDKSRNSNLDAWARFADTLKLRGFYPVVVPDTEAAFDTKYFHEAHLFRECAWNLGLRMALYETSFVNFYVPNGCAILAVLSATCSYVVMNTLPKGSVVTTAEAYRQIGLVPGQSYKFAQPNQRMNINEDTFENILKAFDDFVREFRSDAPCR